MEAEKKKGSFVPPRPNCRMLGAGWGWQDQHRDRSVLFGRARGEVATDSAVGCEQEGLSRGFYECGQGVGFFVAVWWFFKLTFDCCFVGSLETSIERKN